MALKEWKAGKDYVIKQGTDKNGHRQIGIYPQGPFRIDCEEITRDADGAVRRTSVEELLPSVVEDFFLRTPEIRFFLSEGSLYTQIFDREDMSKLLVATTSLAEVRKAINDLAQSRNCFSKEEAQEVLRDCFRFLFQEEESTDWCGCGNKIICTGNNKRASRCQSCDSILCTDCSISGSTCDGCFALLQEASENIEGDLE